MSIFFQNIFDEITDARLQSLKAQIAIESKYRMVHGFIEEKFYEHGNLIEINLSEQRPNVFEVRFEGKETVEFEVSFKDDIRIEFKTRGLNLSLILNNDGEEQLEHFVQTVYRHAPVKK